MLFSLVHYNGVSWKHKANFRQLISLIMLEFQATCLQYHSFASWFLPLPFKDLFLKFLLYINIFTVTTILKHENWICFQVDCKGQSVQYSSVSWLNVIGYILVFFKLSWKHFSVRHVHMLFSMGRQVTSMGSTTSFIAFPAWCLKRYNLHADTNIWHKCTASIGYHSWKE